MNKPIEVQTLSHWIGGKPVASRSGPSGEVTKPATGAVTKRVPFANPPEVDAAVKRRGA
jgi:malonate-semialdehyde dehydrogenase (acetylating) / methylmalonate-semialdehyde dehydrogenase